MISRGFNIFNQLNSIAISALTSLCLATTGCSTVHYLVQAGQGQLALVNHARPISEVLQDERTPPRLKALLGEIGSIKKFGESMGLKPTPNYSDYVQLDRPAAVWVVSACRPLEFKAKEWSFPIVGSFPYLGWFDRKDAENYVTDLKKEGWDVDLRGAGAYSTLGWFRDPVLSSMISPGDEALGDLVNVVIHESVHATIYINGQSYFNESLASFVADRLTQTYLDKTRGATSPEALAYKDSENRRLFFEKRLHQSYTDLETLYQSNLPDTEKLNQKQKILENVQKELQFKREINNATLIQFKTYSTGEQDFQNLLVAYGSDWNRFLKALHTLTPASFSKPQQEDLRSVLARVSWSQFEH